MTVVVDQTVVSSPKIQSPITDGEAVLVGVGNVETRRYAAMLRGGVLPVRLQVTDSMTGGR
jgi:preprotein translocase subunit SecD